MSKSKKAINEDILDISSEESFEDTTFEYGTPIRSRQRFSAEETSVLESYFRNNLRPSADTKGALAQRFDTTPSRIQIWFQNRRAKEKKLKKKETSPEQSEEETAGPSVQKEKLSRDERQDLISEHVNPYLYPGYPVDMGFLTSPSHQGFIDPRHIQLGGMHARTLENISHERESPLPEEEEEEYKTKGKKILIHNYSSNILIAPSFLFLPYFLRLCKTRRAKGDIKNFKSRSTGVKLSFASKNSFAT